ncbi:hypothetical protein GCM10010446_39040 [Streptomyces enissocaesilis]|uniref:DNA primase n=1 Tax=Streptomyces enissocaesilis TaxID=332589 RepID=A0ABP6JVB1_9ACTN
MVLDELDELDEPDELPEPDDELVDDAAGFESEPEDEDDAPAFEGDVAGVLLDEEPRLSFR